MVSFPIKPSVSLLRWPGLPMVFLYSANSCYLKSQQPTCGHEISAVWWLCLIRSRFRTITLPVKGSPGYFHHPYITISLLVLCCLCPSSPGRIWDFSAQADWWMEFTTSVSFPLGAGGEAGAFADDAEAIQPAIAFVHGIEMHKSVQNTARSPWSGLQWVCDPGGSLLSRWTWVGWPVCAVRAGSVSCGLVWCHGQSAVWEHAISWLSGLLQMASRKKILFRSGTGK